MSRYIIIGAGGVGVTLAAELQRAGRDVLLVARGAQLEFARAGKLRYIRPDGDRLLDLPVVGGPDEVTLTGADVLVLATKTQDAEAVIAEWAAQPVRPADGGSGHRPAAACLPLVTTQNGLETERIALRRFASVLGGVLWVPASYVRPGEVISPAAPAVAVLWLGVYPGGSHPRLAGIAADLRAANVEVQVVPDILRWKAAKLTASVTFALTALYPPGDLRDQAAALLKDEARETLAAAGYGIADVATEVTADLSRFSVLQVPGRGREGNSTWQSLSRSGSLETDFLNGEVVLAARLAGRTAPASQAIAERARRAVRDGVAPGSLTEDDLRATLPQLNGVLIDAASLHRELGRPSPPAILDVRWALGDPHGRAHYLNGHIPTAVYADLDTQLLSLIHI